MPPPYAIRVRTAAGWQDIAIQGATGDPGAVDVYEQPAEPVDAVLGAIWIDTDAPTPEPADGPPGPEGPPGPAGGTLIPGGTTDQVLAKKTSADHDVEWVDPGGGAAAVWIDPAAPVDPEANLWIDTDEPGVDIQDWAGLDTRVDVIEASRAVVTALPSTPFDGQEIYYRFLPSTTPASTVPLLWHLRWDASNAAWLPVGEQRPIYTGYYPGVVTSMGSGSWGTYDANDPRVNAVPLAGTYECETGWSEAYCGGLAINFNVGIAKNGTIWAQGGGSSAVAGWPFGAQLRDVNTFVVNDLIRQFYFLTTAGPQNVVIRGRYLTIRPMRITP